MPAAWLCAPSIVSTRLTTTSSTTSIPTSASTAAPASRSARSTPSSPRTRCRRSGSTSSRSTPTTSRRANTHTATGASPRDTGSVTLLQTAGCHGPESVVQELRALADLRHVAGWQRQVQGRDKGGELLALHLSQALTGLASQAVGLVE